MNRPGLDLYERRESMAENRLKIAVVGGGVAGVTAAHILQSAHDVTLYEKNSYVGGHTYTVVVDHGPDEGTAVDMGFIVFNNQTYPTFSCLLNQLKVPVRTSEMSFSFVCEKTDLEYAGTSLGGLFAQKRNLVRPSFLKMLAGIARFGKEAMKSLENGELTTMSLGEYLEKRCYGPSFISNYLLPMASAIWSTPAGEILHFPAETFVHFLRNHGLLSFKDRPLWQTVSGGSCSYIQAFLERFQGRVLLSAGGTGIRRREGGIDIRTSSGETERFNRVVLGVHADQSLRLLEDPTTDEKSLLGAWSYQKNLAVLHTDTSFLPSRIKARASWNYRRTANTGIGAPVSVTYWMNRLQGLNTHEDYCVTLNPARSIHQNRIIREVEFEHPLYNFQSVATQKDLPRLNGKNNTYFCGSFLGYGFHEDAVKSGIQVARCFGLEL
jgi:uncharacterized protein